MTDSKASNSHFVKTIVVTDPDTGNPIEVCLYKHQSGWMFGVDSSHIERMCCEDTVFDPIDGKPVALLSDQE